MKLSYIAIITLAILSNKASAGREYYLTQNQFIWRNFFLRKGAGWSMKDREALQSLYQLIRINREKYSTVAPDHQKFIITKNKIDALRKEKTNLSEELGGFEYVKSPTQSIQEHISGLKKEYDEITKTIETKNKLLDQSANDNVEYAFELQLELAILQSNEKQIYDKYAAEIINKLNALRKNASYIFQKIQMLQKENPDLLLKKISAGSDIEAFNKKIEKINQTRKETAALYELGMQLLKEACCFNEQNCEVGYANKRSQTGFQLDGLCNGLSFAWLLYGKKNFINCFANFVHGMAKSKLSHK